MNKGDFDDGLFSSLYPRFRNVSIERPEEHRPLGFKFFFYFNLLIQTYIQTTFHLSHALPSCLHRKIVQMHLHPDLTIIIEKS